MFVYVANLQHIIGLLKQTITFFKNSLNIIILHKKYNMSKNTRWLNKSEAEFLGLPVKENDGKRNQNRYFIDDVDYNFVLSIRYKNKSPLKQENKSSIKVDLTPPSFKDQEGMHILLGCNHVPFQDVKLHKGIYRLIKNHKSLVKGFHLMGDFMDINSLSSHDKGKFTAIKGLTLDSEYDSGNKILDFFDEVLDEDVWKTYLYGNHEDRWNRWMSNMDNAKTPLKSPKEALRLIERGYHVKTNWSQDYFTLGKDFDIFHGIYFSIHSAKAHIDKLRRSCAYVHTHRQQFYREGSLMAYNLGTCADIDSKAFNYATRPMKASWGKGFAVNMIDKNGNSNVTLITPDKNSNFWFGGIQY